MFELRNNQRVHLRPIQPEDAALLQRLHSRLSTDSVYHRFFGTMKELPDHQAAAFARVDFEERVAIIAEAREKESHEILGVARYSLDPTAGDPAAELAIVVEDRYQNQGLGSHLLLRLIEIAHRQGIRLLKATVQPDNQQTQL